MTRHTGRPHGWPRARSCWAAGVVICLAVPSAGPALAAGDPPRHAKALRPHVAQSKGAHPKVAQSKARRAHARSHATPFVHSRASDAPEGELSLSDEFDRAELVEQMLSECRGIPYNAYELAQTSGEALRLPAPIQLMTVRVRHPYCAELLRTYAHKSRV